MANLQAGPGDIKIAIGGIPGSCTTSPGLDKATRVIEMSMEIPAIPISRILKAMASAQGAGPDLADEAHVVEWWNANAPAGLRPASSCMCHARTSEERRVGTECVSRE